jgi:hypothetical protein
VSYGPDETSFVAAGGAGIIGVNVLVAVWPTMSVTRYVIAGFVPDNAELSAVNVTMPVAGSSTYVPSPVIVTELSASHVVVPGVNRHVAVAPVVARPVPVAKPEEPVIVVKATDDPGSTSFVSGVATGAGGGSTVNVIVDDTVRFRMSVT